MHCGSTNANGMGPPPIPGFTIALDLVSFQSIPSKEGYKYVLTMIDQFINFLRFLHLKRIKTPKGVACTVLEEWVRLFGTPTLVQIDGRGEFKAHVVWKLSGMLGIKKEMSCPKSP